VKHKSKFAIKGENSIMEKCISCKKDEGVFAHNSGGYVCENCIGHYFTCPECGMIFDNDDENADAGNGFCGKCAPNH
jgi:hypothetical protein